MGSGTLRFKFMLGGSPRSPWEDFQSNRKILSLIGICHCPTSHDLQSVAAHFAIASKTYSSALVSRCFAFCPGDSQLEEESYKGSNLVLFPRADGQTHEFHLQMMLHDIAASLLMEFEKYVLQAESGGMILKTPLDSQESLNSEEVDRMGQKRKQVTFEMLFKEETTREWRPILWDDLIASVSLNIQGFQIRLRLEWRRGLN